MDASDTPLAPLPELDDGVVRLRRWELSDLACVEATSEAGLTEGSTIPEEYTDETGRAWIERQHARTETGRGWSWAIAQASSGRAVGCVNLLLRRQDGVAGVGYWLVPDARGAGLATRAVTLVTTWGLDEVGLARVEAWVEPGNDASVAVLERCGYGYEGRLRSFLAFPTRRADALVYSRISPQA